MTRKKVTLAYITNDSDRKASYKKRKKGFIKKMKELTTLCGVDACAIIYSPYDPAPVFWPSPQGVEAVMARFRRLSEMDQTRKMVNQESFTRQRIKKAEGQLRRVQKENKRRQLENFMFQCLAGIASLEMFDLQDAAEMGWVVNQTLREINSGMEGKLKDNDNNPNQGQEAQGSSSAPLPLPPPPPPEAVYTPLPAVASPLLHQAALEMMGEENMDSVPWNLVESPTGAGSSTLGGLRWDLQDMALPYPHIFNNGAADAGPWLFK